MSISHIIFDLDDTLCNYQEAKTFALKTCFDRVVDTLDKEKLMAAYLNLEPALFRLFAAGVISRTEYRTNRFALPLQLLHIPAADALVRQLNALYIAQVDAHLKPFDDVRACLDELGKRYQLSLFTNGPSDGQRRKLAVLDIDQYFQHIFISEEIGFAKPDQRAYLHVLNTLQCGADHALMIGDSLELDIYPAHDAGMAACHLNRQRLPTHDECFHSLKELVDESAVIQ